MVTSDSQFWISMAKNKLYMLAEVWKGSLEGRTLRIQKKTTDFYLQFTSLKRIASLASTELYLTRHSDLLYSGLKHSKDESEHYESRFWPLVPAASLSATAFSSQFCQLRKLFSYFSPMLFSHTFSHPSRCRTVGRKTRLQLSSAISLPSCDTDTPEALSTSPVDLLSFQFIKHMQRRPLGQKNRATSILSKAIKSTSPS